ncbi:hypothetical protein [Archangium sp.]|uniref:hypothetical protein n=1 Tax=Archangium sp. TaxID=1872627 RepID=UPI00286A5B1B|nr:hypothetical protein [Archangium sp.]
MNFRRLLALLCFALAAGCATTSATPKMPEPLKNPALTPSPKTLEAYRRNGMMARPVSSTDRAELDAFFAARQQAISTGQMDVLFAQEDYPVIFQTDDAKGQPVTFIMDHQRYLEMMSQAGPYFPDPSVQLQHGPREYIFITDSLVIAHQLDTYDFGTEKATWPSANLLIKRNGQWKNKAIIEGGFGEFLTANGVLREEDMVQPRKK